MLAGTPPPLASLAHPRSREPQALRSSVDSRAREWAVLTYLTYPAYPTYLTDFFHCSRGPTPTRHGAAGIIFNGRRR